MISHSVLLSFTIAGQQADYNQSAKTRNKMYIIHQTSDIIAIATRNSSNRKTGKSVQIWIMDARMHPSESRNTGADADNQCNGCEFASRNGCYVNDNPLGAIWRAYQRGSYEFLHMGTREWYDFFSVPYVRFGAYGNPSHLPLEMIYDISKLAKRITGYFHDWHQMPATLAKAYGRYFMASTNEKNVEYAKNLGLRTFTVSDSAIVNDIECLADAKGLTCSECGLCDGNNRRSNLPSVWINPHGYQVRKAKEALV